MEGGVVCGWEEIEERRKRRKTRWEREGRREGEISSLWKSEANSRYLFQSLLRRSSINLQLSSDINYQRLKQLSGWGVCIFLFLLLPPSGVSAHLLQCCAGQCEQFLPLNLLSRKVSNTGKSGQTKDLADHNVLGLKSIAVYATSTILKNMEWPMLVRLMIVNTQTVCSESALIPASYRHAWFVLVKDQSGNARVIT